MLAVSILLSALALCFCSLPGSVQALNDTVELDCMSHRARALIWSDSTQMGRLSGQEMNPLASFLTEVYDLLSHRSVTFDGGYL